MDPRQKKTTRDLSDLKSRLGLSKPGASPAPTAAPPQPGAPGYAPAPAAGAAPSTGQYPSVGVAATLQRTVPLAAPGAVVPPPGVMPPPGMMPYAQPQPPPPDPRRDPFAARPAGVQFGYQQIVDAGPPIEIPQEKKSHIKLIITLIITAVIPLGVGWACGRIYGARVLFNKSIVDAKQIQEEVTRISGVNAKIVQTLGQSQVRNKGKVLYDEKLVEDLKDILRSSPSATPERAKKQQEQLFRTNYAMMEGIVVDRLFNYYNNTIRLYGEIEGFVQKADRTKELVKSYSPEAEKGQQKYGIVFASDEGKYYLGQIVEVGNIDCANPEARECRRDDIKGFMVRMGATGAWSPRPGKAGAKQKITDIVVPIIPDENWKKVAVGKKGYLEFNDYVIGYSRLAAICGLLSRDEKPLLQDLGKASGRPKVFAPF